MKVFLIVVAVLVLITVLILSLSAEATIIYDNGWKTTVQVLFIKKDVELSKILNFVLFPEKAGKQAAEKLNEKESIKSDKKPVEEPIPKVEEAKVEVGEAATVQNTEIAEEKPQPKAENNGGGNMITKIVDDDGIVGIMLLVSNLIETINSAVITLFRGLHIYSLYVKIIVGGDDAADIGNDYGTICGIYYPIKGIILNGMRVDNYDDYITADFIAPQNEYEFQLIGSMSVGLIVKIGLKAGKTFLVNLIKNK